MWLLPAFSTTARIALGTFYRFQVRGAKVPARGPVLLVANHPNSLLDPAAVVAAADRPVRFLAKAPLFTDRQVGWLVRGAGAIPVYRPADDPTQVERNRDTFSAVHEALRAGAAVGIFPEGISHSQPAIAPLKTGAGRIALGAADGKAFPIIPVGLSFRDKRRFRSEALVVVGEAVEWADLADAGDDPGAVRELTARIDRALRTVTLNLQSWEDAPLVEYAQEIFLAEHDPAMSPEARLAGQREVAEGLERISREGWEQPELAHAVRLHARTLRALGLRPAQLLQPSTANAFRWAGRTAVLMLVAVPLLVVGGVIFWIPFRLVGTLESRARHTPDVAATFKLLVGATIHLMWIAILALATAARFGALAGMSAGLALPLLGLGTVRAVEWRREAGGAFRRFLMRRRRAELIAELATEQRRIAAELAALRTLTRP